MELNKACSIILNQLSDLVEQISEQDYIKPSEALNGSTIGQHLRHTLEFFICFEQGYEQGLVNYDKRLHDKVIETDKFIALATINQIKNFVSSLEADKALKLEVSYNPGLDDFTTIDTTLNRELVYNIEHAVHHMAIIKIGLREVAPYVKLPNHFGIAASTVRYKESVVGISR